MAQEPIYSPPPTTSPKTDKTMLYIIVGAGVLCCLCFGLLGVLMISGEAISQMLGG